MKKILENKKILLYVLGCLLSIWGIIVSWNYALGEKKDVECVVKAKYNPPSRTATYIVVLESKEYGIQHLNISPSQYYQFNIGNNVTLHDFHIRDWDDSKNIRVIGGSIFIVMSIISLVLFIILWVKESEKK